MPEAAEPDSYFWAGVCVSMLRLRPVEHRQTLLDAWDAGLIEPMIFHRKDIEDHIDRPAEPARLAELVEHALTPDVHAWLEWWACFREDRRAGAISRPDPKARRQARSAKKKARKRERSARKKKRKKKR